MAKTLNLSPSQTRAAFVTYSTLPRTIAQLRGYTTQQFDQIVDRATLLRGSRRVDRAIDEAARILRTNGQKPKKIVVLLTAGRQTPGDKTLSTAAKPLRDIGADLYVMAIGSLVNIEELLPVVDKPEDIFRIPSHEALSEQFKPISAQIAKRAGTRPLVPKDFSAEVVFLVDASVTVTPSIFELEKEFVKTASKSLQVSPDKTRAAVITYSDNTENVVELGKYQTLADFEYKVDSARLLRGVRRIDKALESAADTLRKSRPGVPRLVVLLTAGRQFPGASSLDKAVQPLKNLGAQTFVVAIGNQPDTQELGKAVERPEDLFRVVEYEKLPGDANRIVIILSKRASVPQPTDFTADVVFMIDASSSVSQNDYRTEKDFVKAVAKLLNVAPGKSRASLVTYSNNPSVVFRLNGYRNSLDFEQQVDRAPLLGGSRRMDKALETAGTILNEARRNAPKIAVLLTTGRQSAERDTKLLDEAVKPLDSVGAKTYVIAIGKRPDIRELSLAVKKLEDVLQVYSFRDLLAKAQPAAQKMIKETQSTIPEPLDADIVFLVDSSSFVSFSNFEREKSFVKSLAHFLNVNPGKSRASVVSFSSNPQLVSRFYDYRSQREFNSSVDRVPYLSGRSRRIDKALDEAVNIFKEARPGVTKILVLLTSGVQTSAQGAKDLQTAFEPLRKQGVKNIVIAVGSNIDGKEFEKTLDKPKDLLRVNSYVTLPTQGKDISDKITMSLMEPLDLTSDIVFVVDSSSTVNRPNYKKERDFVKSLAKALNVGNGKSRASVITYGRNTRVETKFDEYRTMSEFEQIVEDALYMGGARRMDRALESAAQLLSLARPQAKKIVVFFTAGRQGLGAKSLVSAIKPVHDRGAKVFVVALGEEPDIRKLTSLVDQPDDIFRVSSFDGLRKRAVPTSRVIAARSGISKALPKRSMADIVFLADSSSDVPRWRFDEQKEFVKKLSKTFNIAPDSSRASFISYGSAQILVGGFHNTPSAFDSAVTSTSYVGGSRRLDLAVNAALKLFKESRPGVSKVLVLITAGRNSPGSAPLNTYTQKLQELGVNTYVVTIGTAPDANSLLPIVDKRSDIIPVSSYDRLPTRINDIQLIILQSFRPVKPLDLSADVIFMIDTSSDVTPGTIKLQKDFVKMLSKQFNIAPGKARVALIVYGSRGEAFVKLDSVSTPSDFTSLVDRAPIIGGRRRMDKALDTASLILTGARSRVSKIAFLLTAGAQAPGTPDGYLSTAARLLRDMDARTYVISIGSQVIEREISSIPEKQRDIIRVKSGSELPSSVVSVFNVIVQDYGKGPVDQVYDVVFVMDSSSTVVSQDFERQKQFVKSFARQFGISRDRSRGALVTYGTYANLDVRFDGYENLVDFDAAVDRAERVGGDRKMGQALDMASRVLLEARPKAHKVVILFTAGRQSQTAGTWFMESASRSLKNIGAKTYVVAIGNQPDSRELRPLVDRDSDILRVVSLANIDDLTGTTITLVTDGTGPLKPSKVTADIVFLIDSSSGVTTQDYTIQKDFVKNLARSMSVTPGKSRGALITYGSFPRSVFGFDGYKTVQDFNRNVDNAPYIGGPRQMDTALNAAKTLLDRGNPQAVKIVVPLTSDTQMTDDTRRRLNEVTKSLRSSGVLTYVVAIGSRPNVKDLGTIVDRPDDVMTVKSFTDLRPYVDSAVQQIMNGVSSRLDFKADIVFMMDGSSEVSSATFAREKQLVKTLARYFNVKPGASRAGVLVYGSSSNEVLRLGADQSLSIFDFAVDRARLVGGARRIDRVLESAARLFLTARKGVPKIGVLLTTGRQADESGAKPLAVARQPLTDVNARLFVIGIGQRADVRQMNKIASSPNDVFVLRLPNDLLSKVPTITQHTKDTANKGQVHRRLPSTDAIFLIDSSDEVTTDEYERQKDIIKSITRSFDIGLSNTRVAVIAYSDRGSNAIEFDTYGNILDLHRGIDGIPYLGGRRRLDVAVTQANALLSETRPQANKVVFLLTTGRHRQEFGSTPLRATATPLHGKAQVFVIGIGSRPDVQELQQLASRDANVYMIPFSGNIRPQIEVIQIQVASGIESPKQMSDQKIDLLFVVDSSDSVGRTNFLKSKEFVKAFVRAFQVSPEKTHVALIRFGNTAELSIGFGKYTNIRDFNRAVDNVGFVGGVKRLDKALVLAARVLPQARPSSKKIAVIISDGKQAQGPGVEPLDFAAEPLHGIGAKVYVIGTGSRVDIPQLQKITRKPGDLFVSRSYDDLLQQILYLIRHMTKGPTTSPQGYTADVMFLVDSSDSLTNQEFQYQKDFLKEISRRLRVAPVGTRAGFITYNDNAQLRMNFNSYNTTAEFYDQLSQIRKEGGGRRLDKAIELAGQTFAGVRRNAAKLLIIFAKGRRITDPDSKPLTEVIRPLKNQGVVTNVLAIGPRVDVVELTSIALRPENILIVDSYDALRNQVHRIWKHIVGTTVVSCNKTLDVGILMDSSGSLGKAHYTKQRDFIKSIIRELVTASPNSRVGIIPFSDYAEVAINFEDFESMSASARDASIDGLPYEQGRTRIDRALDTANRGLFTTKRYGVPQVLILITDGRQSKDPGHTPVNQAIIPLRSKGIKTLTVGIGKDFSLEELKLITPDNMNIFIVGAFDELEGIVRGLVSRSCSL